MTRPRQILLLADCTCAMTGGLLCPLQPMSRRCQLVGPVTGCETRSSVRVQNSVRSTRALFVLSAALSSNDLGLSETGAKLSVSIIVYLLHRAHRIRLGPVLAAQGHRRDPTACPPCRCPCVHRSRTSRETSVRCDPLTIPTLLPLIPTGTEQRGPLRPCGVLSVRCRHTCISVACHAPVRVSLGRVSGVFCVRPPADPSVALCASLGHPQHHSSVPQRTPRTLPGADASSSRQYKKANRRRQEV